MTLTSSQLALTVARVGAMRIGAFRIGFAPPSTRSEVAGSTGPLYFWKRRYTAPYTWVTVKAPGMP